LSGESRTKHVLAVDDDPAVRAMITDYLVDQNLRLSAAADGGGPQSADASPDLRSGARRVKKSRSAAAIARLRKHRDAYLEAWRKRGQGKGRRSRSRRSLRRATRRLRLLGLLEALQLRLDQLQPLRRGVDVAAPGRCLEVALGSRSCRVQYSRSSMAGIVDGELWD
jgi:CheY-like chemotaxis protein